MKQFARCQDCSRIFPHKDKQMISLEGKAVGVCPECYERLVNAMPKERLVE